MLFWLAMVAVCTCLYIYESRNGPFSRKIEDSIFWAFGFLMVLFAAFRPNGIARDDKPYLTIFETICPTLTCQVWVQGDRDMVWYSLVGILKSFSPEPQVMLFLAAMGLIVKLFVIYKLVKRPLIVLVFYTGLFYQIQDLTAWRVSLAIAAFLSAILLIVWQSKYRNSWVLFLCGLFHKQGYVAPLILLGVFFRKNRKLLLALCLIPVGLLIVDVYPKLHLLSALIEDDIQRLIIAEGLDGYIDAKNKGVYQGWRNAPITVYPFILLILWFVILEHLKNNHLDAMLVGCVLIACLFLWVFASLPVVQVRFFEFFMVPTLLLVGMSRLRWFEFAGVILVAGIHVAKYNVVNQIFIQP